MLSILWIERIAASLGALSVSWLTQQKPAAWPVGLLMVLRYIWIFYDPQLYAKICLQWRGNLRLAV